MVDNTEKYNSYRIAVPKAFENIFSHFYFAENTNTKIITKTFLPSYQTILIFSFGSKTTLQSKDNTEIKIDKYLLLGPIKQAFNYDLFPNSKILVVNFKADTFYRFFGDISQNKYQELNSDGLSNENCFMTLWSELYKIKNTKQRIDHILHFCRPYLQEQNKIAEKLINIKSKFVDPIKLIADQEQQTERNVQLIHKKQLGYSAKEINRYQRFIKAIQLIQNNTSKSIKVNWLDIINECGYYDQSHLILDFKNYLNLTPTNYLKFQQNICMVDPD
ncbi:helix-turn-helix domain-containing protein [Polaribacter staleyi]|uniref:helix-turn-helix domain-containing protein n=1 Tax=Polaribacter staleyi TaxID=2022337 RepID=UPI0031BA6593